MVWLGLCQTTVHTRQGTYNDGRHGVPLPIPTGGWDHVFTKLTAAVDRLRGEASTEDQRAASALKSREEAEAQAEETDGGRRSDLFHCPTCDTVYVATGKRTCSKCEGTVEQVRSTLRNR